VALFFPSIGPAAPFEMRQEKTWLQLQKSGMMIKEKQQEFAAKKGKKSDGGCSCKVSFSLFGVEKIQSFMMIQPPSPAFNIILQFKSLILTLFDSVLGPKEILRISPANLGYILPAAEFSALTLDIQMGIS
jgi:hypothetical protein